jgi:succinyl-diaminopimelate desuccinylase
LSPFDYIDRHPSDLIGRLQQLIGITTVNPPGENYDAITAWLTHELDALGLKAKRYVVPAALAKKTLPAEQHTFPRFNVLGKLAAAKSTKKTVLFNAHYDVVPVSGTWRHGSPFSGAVEKGWIYGRGTADMKGSIASLLMALQALRATGTKPAINVEVAFTADEETDSVLGSGWLVDYAPIKPTYAVVMEGGEANGICCGHNGVLWLEVQVHGLAAHGSRPAEGINALENLSRLVLALDEYKALIAQRSFTTPDGTVMTPTVNVGGVFAAGAGGKINTVPAFGSFSIDRRVLANENQVAAEKELRAFLAAAAKKIPKCKITVTKVSENLSCFTQPTTPFFKAVADSVGRMRGEKTQFRVSTGFNDMYYFAKKLGVETVGYGPGGLDCHAVDERAEVKELLASARIYADLMLQASLR